MNDWHFSFANKFNEFDLINYDQFNSLNLDDTHVWEDIQ